METFRAWLLLRQLRADVRTSADSLSRLQDALLREAVDHAYAHVPFYRRFWDEHGFDPRTVRGHADVSRIPIVSSETIREAARCGELLARGVDPDQCSYLDSSGSSGKPLRILKRDLEERVRRAVGLRIMLEHGFRWRHTTAQFQILPGPSHPLQQIGIARKTWISTVDSLEEQLRQFVESRADFVVGTPTALRRITEAIASTGAKPKRPRMVFCAGELLDRATADIVRRVLGVAPAGIYGQTEVGYVAWQCERRDHFHLSTDTHLVEIVRAGKLVGPGELGEVVITDLRSRTMPFLRYRTTDLAVAASGPCPCGRTQPVLSSLEGRARECLVLKNGRVLTAREIVNNLSDMAAPGTYRIEQLTHDRFRLQLLPHAARGGGAGIVGRLHRILGEVEISMETVNSWAPDGTGKTHTIDSGGASPRFA